jgi:tetratricopeptide (TPR) repeat protein
MSEPIVTPPPPTPEQLAAWAEAQAAAEREIAEADAAARAAAVAPTPITTSAPRRGPGAVLYALPVFLGVGAAVASAFVSPHPTAKPDRGSIESPAGAPEAPHAGDLVAIDALIRAGCFADALKACQSETNRPPAARRAQAYREAVCLEALGRLKEAVDAYRRAEPPEGDKAAWARTVLGRARCALAADDVESAQGLLDRVVKHTGHPDCVGTHVYEECLFLRARIDAMRLGPVRAMDPFDPDAVAWPPLGGALDKYFDWLPPDTPPAPSSGTVAGPNVAAVRRGAAGVPEVTAHLAERPVPDLLKAIATAAGWHLRIEEPVTAVLAKDSTALAVESMPINELLDALFGPAAVSWKLEADVLTVASAGARGTDRAATIRSFQRAVAAAPAHPFAAAARIWLANFDFGDGRVREAGKEYQRTIDEALEGPLGPYALYNLGLAELRRGELRAAQSRFVNLSDRAPRGRWADYGRWWTGRMALDVGDRAGARKVFSQARGGQTREVTSAAAIATCACELLDGNDDPARTVLRESRIDSRGDHAALAALFERLLLYRVSPSESRRGLVLDALAATADARGLGPAGPYLAGRVYRDLDLPHKMAALYDAVTNSTRGPLAQRMTFDAAAWYDLMDRFEPARQRYLAVAATDPKGLGPQAEFRLAEMAYRQRKAAECVQRCRALLDRGGVERAEVLLLMGRAYESQHKHRLAADCFAGRVPAE